MIAWEGYCRGAEMAWQAGEEPQPEWTLEELIELHDAGPAFDDPFDYEEALDDCVRQLVEKYGELWEEAIIADWEYLFDGQGGR